MINFIKNIGARKAKNRAVAEMLRIEYPYDYRNAHKTRSELELLRNKVTFLAL